MTELKKLLIPEAVAFIGILIGSLFITSYKPYLILLSAYVGAVYFFSLNPLNAVWQGFVSALLFYKGKYSVFPFVSQTAVGYGLTTEAPIIYHVTFADVMLIVLLYTIFRNRTSAERPLSPHLQTIAIVASLLLMVGAMSSLWSVFPGVSWFSLFKIAEYILIFFAALHVFHDQHIRSATLKNILLFVFLNACLILLQKTRGGPLGFAAEDFTSGSLGRFSDENTSLYRPGGIYFEPNLPATLMVLFLPIVSWYGVIKSTSSVWFFVPMGLLLFAIIATASRVNWFLSALCMLALFFLTPVALKLKRKGQLKIAGLLLGVGVLTQLPLVVNRVGSLGAAFNEESGGYSFRVHQLQLAFEMMSRNVFGVGVDVFQYQLLESFKPEDYYSHFTSAHNVLAEVAAGFGIMGLILYGVLLFLFLKHISTQIMHFWRKGKRSSVSFSAGLPVFLGIGYVGFIGSSMFFPWFFAPPLTELSWITLAMMYGYSRIR